MPRWVDDADDWSDDPDADEDFSEEDDEPTIPCPYCRREVHEDAQRCPYCEAYLSREDAPPGPKPWWLVLGVVACLYVVYHWTFRW
jgi:hypothetical protein